MFGSDGSPIVQYVVIFAVIFTALAAIVFTVRRITGRSLALPGRGNGRGRQPRLGIVDVYELDRARQLILLRRDNVEHLLLVGGPNDVVVERNIQRGQRPLPEAALRSEAGPDSLDEPLADPLVQGGRLPEPPRALQDNPGRRAEPLFDPGFAMPVVVPPPVPRSSVQPAVTLPIDAALLADDETGPEASAAFMPPLRAPVAESPAAPREPASPRRIFSRTPPPLVEPRTGPASERGTIPGPAAGLDEPSRQAPSLTVPSERRSVDPAVLSDMARQLQAALSRPSSAVTSAPVPALPFDGVDPMAATMAAEPRVLAPVPSPEPVPAFAPVPIPAPEPPPALEPVPEAVSKPAAASRPAPLPAVPASAPKPVEPPSVQIAVEAPPVSPQRSIEPPPLAPSPSLPADAPPPPQVAAQAVPAPASKGSGTPFSVEEIEAEFARLLGRPLDKRT